MARRSATMQPEGRAASEAGGAISGYSCTNTALRKAARRMNQLYDEAMAPIGLTAAQGRLLGEIDRMAAAKGEGPALQVLAGLLGVQISALTHALRPLVRDGLVKVRIDAHDRRTKHAVLTALGSERLGRAVALWQEANARVEAVLGPSAEMLRELAEQVSSEAFLEAYRAGKRIPAQCDKKGPA